MKRKWLVDIRKSQGYTQQDIADKAGVHRSTYSQYEQGIRNPSITSAKKVANALGFRWENFFEETRCEKNHTIA
ncbi:helix-turn-helix transcriptional regulator [Mechercharimyces sp. CAU 1602]|uniref:helix-turn-helix transcriptional regulator n=1 Tax=Mechercharimyces sp. CAU 1602 TaxID=2973933 RepID=UPI002161BC5E|nr:helix-turn-helix transcriptional regulator [Mechercharimyces sp. CAU 1602]MCS1351189.1 helix-turn-helix domain-containing protein [Mechercharimyces sp. CAU 1602]